MNEGPLAPIHSTWIEQLLGAPLPAENRATCNDCRLAPPHSGQCGNDVVFSASTKCCTYWPGIPNYLVGSLLTDTAPEGREGREQFERTAETRAIVNPIGVFPSREYASSYRWHYSNLSQRESLLCPYYLQKNGLCGIWRHRNGRCSTWFCRHERGATSRNFWTALDFLLQSLEDNLSRWCLSRIPEAPSWKAGSKNYPEHATAAEWGAWNGKESEFFRACWSGVERLRWHEIEETLGEQIRDSSRAVCAAFKALQSGRLPSRLVPGSIKIEPIDANRSRVWAYSVFDSADMDNSLLKALEMFDGSETATILERIFTQKGIRIDLQRLQQLVDMQILIPA